MNVGSVFSGVGGIDLGLERAGMSIRWMCEQDEYCRRLLRQHWPSTPISSDIRHLRGESLEAVDLICGGFPCQDLSVAGKGAGLAGDRSSLWYEMLRLVREMRPRWVCAENVPALRARGADQVLSGLEAEGYACWPLVVGARHAGAPHRRDRVFIVARRDDMADADGEPIRDQPKRDQWGRRRERTPECGDTEPRNPGATDMADGDRRNSWPARPGEAQHPWEAPRVLESPMGSATARLPKDVARWRRTALKALGNSVVPQVAEAIGRAILAADHGQ